MAVDTWFAAHNRRNHLKLGHWNTINNAERKETKAKLKMVKGGMELKDCSKTEFKTPKSIYEVSECLRLKELVKNYVFNYFFSVTSGASSPGSGPGTGPRKRCSA